MKKQLLLMAIFLFAIFMKAQIYQPIDTADRSKREEFKKHYELSNKEYINNLKKEYSGKIKSRLVENEEEFSKDFVQNIKDGDFLFEEKFTWKAKEIFKEIQDKNPEIERKINVLIAKDPSLNAYCSPNGTFVINLGLFYWLNNYDQMAGVISHELAHNSLKHSIKTQIKTIEQEMSSKNKDVIKKIKKEKINRSEKAFQLFKNMLYAKGIQRQKHEYQADSLGYLYFKKTKYNPKKYIQTLRLMEKYDTIKPSELKQETYKKVFDLPKLTFKEDWLKKEDFSSYDYSKYKEKINKDSVSTHPEINQRIERLIKNFPELKDEISEDEKEAKKDEDFEKLEKIAGLETVPNLYFFEQYGNAIYICLQKIEQDKNTEFYKIWLGKNFQKIYEARKNYTLNRYLDRIDPKEQSQGYQQFLSFMWNLSLSEIKEIADFYSKN